MIRHIVIISFWKKFQLDFVDLVEGSRPYIQDISGLLYYEVFANESDYVPKDIVSVGVEIHFKDTEALKCFMEHPKHSEANARFEMYLADPPFMVLTHTIEK